MTKKINNDCVIAPLLPHGKIQKVFDNIWFVKGQLKMPFAVPMNISRSMTIIKNKEDNELTLINTMRMSEEALAELETIGKITNVIKLGGFHGRDDAFYQERYGAKVFAVEGQTYSRKMKPSSDSEHGYMQPDVWINKNSELPIKNSSLIIFSSCNPPEGILLLEQDGGIIVNSDVLQNTPCADGYENLPMRIMMKMMGFFKPYGIGQGWLKIAKPKKEEILSLLNYEFEHVLPGHGDPVLNKAKEKYAPNLNAA